MDQKYYAFKGIPFAAPPITGTDPYTKKPVDRRFKAPEELEYIWTELLKAHNFSDVCVQSNTSETNSGESEDCLYLNIYVPAGGAVKKTVLVWIHGGAGKLGNGRDLMYGPDFLLSQDNIVVTIQYRLGIFGFLNLGFVPYTGNMALKDQQMALKWVHTNIENFSGRKDQILLFGQSFGGASVHLQMLNEESRKYFNRVFAMSSVAFCPYVISEATQLKQVQNCSQTHKLDKLIKYMKTANSSKLFACDPLPSNGFRLIWAPTIESPSVDGAFLTKMPKEMYKLNEVPAMDTMFSFTPKEMLGIDPYFYHFYHFYQNEAFQEDWRISSLQIPCSKSAANNTFPKGYEKELAILKNAYFSNLSDPNAFMKDNMHFISDLNFINSILAATIAQTKANYNAKKMFLFRFGVHAALNAVAVVTNMSYSGATHIDDLCYMFHCGSLNPHNIYDEILHRKDSNYDKIIRSVKMVTNFARTGNSSIDSNVYFVPSMDPNQIHCGEVSNSLKTKSIDVKKETKYDIWTQVEDIYNGMNCVANPRTEFTPLELELSKFITAK